MDEDLFRQFIESRREEYEAFLESRSVAESREGSKSSEGMAYSESQSSQDPLLCDSRSPSGDSTDNDPPSEEAAMDTTETSSQSLKEDVVMPASSSVSVHSDPGVSGASCATKATEITSNVTAYFTRSKAKMNPDRKTIMHHIRVAAKEAKAMGKKTAKELTPAQRKHILDRVISQCPNLHTHEKEISKTLERVLINAKQYQMKTKPKRVAKEKGGNAGESSANGGTERVQKGDDGGGKPKSSVKGKGVDDGGGKPKSSVKGKGVAKKKKATSKSETIPSQASGSKTSKKRPSMKTSKPVPSTSRSSLTPYELTRKARIRVNNKIKESLMSQPSKLTDSDFTPGDTVTFVNAGVTLGSATFVTKKNEMYAELALIKLLVNNDHVELPQAVSEERDIKRKKKVLVKELEEYDVFLWKLEKIQTKKTLRRDPPGVSRLIQKM